MDGVHLLYQAELGYIWSMEPVYVKSAYGRKRFNVLGAYNTISSETEVVSNDTYLNAQSVVEMMKKLREKHGDREIYIILDNAKYQKCSEVEKARVNSNIDLEYLPSYSPNLNLIERLWKWLRKKCLCNQYKETFKDFCDDILSALSKTGSIFIDEIASWLAPNFIVLGE